MSKRSCEELELMFDVPVEMAGDFAFRVVQEVRTTFCRCKQTKCLKLYCDCFANSMRCAEDCKCMNCSNTPAHDEQIAKSRRSILRRNPSAFDDKIIHGNRHSRGCKCINSKCRKRYCECFQSNIPCTQNCGCQGCENGKDGTFYMTNAGRVVDDFVSALT